MSVIVQIPIQINIYKGVHTMSAIMPKGNLVEEYKIGNTRIKIYDDAYANKTPEDIDRIMKRITAIGWKIVREARAAGKDI